MTIPSSWSLIFEVKSTGSELAFIRFLRLGLDNFAFGRLRTSSEDFGLLQKTSELFGDLRKWSCRLQKSKHSQDKNLTLISQKKLAGIKYHEWYFKIVKRNFEISRVVFMPKYHVQIMLLFVYTTTRKRFVIFTCRYFKLSWNTTALSQSNCRNFSWSSIKGLRFHHRL